MFPLIRLNRDIQIYKENPIKDTAIYQCEDNGLKIYAAIAGPKDSCYEHGMYFFGLSFKNTYPFDPPACEFICWQNNKTRMHPNLYPCGRVCLSIINTYGRKDWTPSMNLPAIIVSLVSIMDANPLRNEPGSHSRPEVEERYRDIVTYHNYMDFTLKTINSLGKFPPNVSILENFTDFIKKYYADNKTQISDRLAILNANNPLATLSVDNYPEMTSTIDYSTVLEEWKKIESTI